MVGQFGEIERDISHQTQKGTDISCGFGNWPFHDAFDFGGVRFNTPLGDVVTQKVDLKQIEMTFFLDYNTASPFVRPS